MSSEDKVLKFLEENKKTFISGETIANNLNLSRNAVWKAINKLRKQGYDIQAVNNKGYMLTANNDIISRQGILSYLGNEYKGVDAAVHVFDSTASTNKTAKEMAIAGCDHGTMIVAKQQELGKGRKDHSFFSPEGGIYLSIVLSPEKLFSLDSDILTAYTGVSVCRSIEKLCNLSPKIKPINDLFVNGRKICGILTESGMEFETGHIQWIVIGIGINFDTDITLFPKDLQPIVGSIFPPGKSTITKNQLIAEIYKQVIGQEAVDLDDILLEYKSRLT